jgi:hypothetical protein
VSCQFERSRSPATLLIARTTETGTPAWRQASATA